MRTDAARLLSPRGEITITPVDLSDPGPGEVLVKMDACGICHSDLFVANLERLPHTPLTLGHEGVGRVTQVGGGVTDLAPGDRVGVTFLASTCGACEFCRSGRERYCARQVNHGYTRDGVLAGYAVVAAQCLMRVPENIPSKLAAPLCCAGWTAYAAIREAGLAQGQTIAIFGLGGLGHLALQYAQHKGLHVAAVDLSEEKLAHARLLGADITLPAENAGRTLLKQHGGMDAAVVLAASRTAIREAFTSLRRNGTLVLVGLKVDDYQLPIVDTVLKGITIRGSYLGTRADLDEVLRLAAAGIGTPQVETHGLARAPELVERLRGGHLLGRAVIVF